MIPTVILAGVLLGRWWWLVPILALAWAALILAANNTADPGLFAGAAAFGAANAAVGFALHQLFRLLVVAPLKRARVRQ